MGQGQSSPNSVVLPQKPITVSDAALNDLIICIDNYISDHRPCDPHTIAKHIEDTGMNPADILEYLKTLKKDTYNIAAHYISYK